MSKQDNQPKSQLPPLASRLIRYILGFTVSVGIGLAPYLGRLDVPFFTPLLALIPKTIQNIAIPLSSALMGIVAVVIQWYGFNRVTQNWSHKIFKRTLIITLTTLLFLIIIHPFIVVTLQVGPEGKDVSYIVGFTRPDKSPCNGGISAAKCVENLTLSPPLIESHWGDQQIAIATLSLLLPYLGFMSSFGMLIGCLLLEESRISKKEKVKKNTQRLKQVKKTGE